jgi:hypothetical protein
MDLEAADELLDRLNIQFIVVELPKDDHMTRGTDEFQTVLKARVPGWSHGLAIIENLRLPNLNASISESTCTETASVNLQADGNDILIRSNFCKEETVELPIWAYPGWRVSSSSAHAALSAPGQERLLRVSIAAGNRTTKLIFRPVIPIWLLVLSFVAPGMLFFRLPSVAWRQGEQRTPERISLERDRGD